jgi:hypothetical protein
VSVPHLHHLLNSLFLEIDGISFFSDEKNECDAIITVLIAKYFSSGCLL